MPGTDTVTNETHTHDGRMHCALCASRTTPEELGWCAIVSSLVCPPCCSGIVAFDPDRMVEALSHTEMAITPDEVAIICATCAVSRNGDDGELPQA